MDVDVLVIGAGFGGPYMLYQMRKEGYKTVLYDVGSDFGGVWHFNAYLWNMWIRMQRFLGMACSVTRRNGRVYSRNGLMILV